jgi:hypothetical protein
MVLGRGGRLDGFVGGGGGGWMVFFKKKKKKSFLMFLLGEFLYLKLFLK